MIKYDESVIGLLIYKKKSGYNIRPKFNQLGDKIWPDYDQLGDTGMSGNVFHEGADPQLKAHFSKQIVVPQCVRIWSIDGIKN